MRNKIEILAPAGDYKALVGAIYGGCDAVYFGTDIFNARIRATNFTLEEAEKSIALAHAHNVRVYITLNTCLYERELTKMLEYVARLHNMGADAFIVADFGVASLIKEHYPQIELHASTQCTVHNLDGLEYLYKTLGFERVVLARELDKKNIEYISKNAPCETEMFVHGAHCMSVSGQCLMSYALGGRSGNRGECAQPCRLPYTIDSKTSYPLSLKDMTLSSHITEILDLGVTSLKIEGRMKNETYVSGTASIWRRLVDEKRNAGKLEIKTLGELFSRQGFTDAYFTNTINNTMLGVRTDKDKSASNESSIGEITLTKPSVNMIAELYEGERAKLTINFGDKSAVSYGDTVEKAINAPMSEDDIKKNLSKLGNTPFALGEINIKKSDNIMVRVSTLNSLRRTAISSLLNQNVKLEISEYGGQALPKPQKLKTATFIDEAQVPQNSDYFDAVFVPLGKYTGKVNGVHMPPVVFDSEWDEIESLLKDAKDKGAKWVLVSNIGQIERVKKYGFEIILDYRFNAFNRPCVEYLMKTGTKNLVISPELNLAQAKDFKGYLVVAYGKLPLMTTHKCILKDTVGCDKCKGYMTDRQGAKFFACGIYGHRNIIYNSVPIYMADKQNDISDFSYHFIFSDEPRDKCYEIIESYKNKKATNGDFRRIK